MKRLNAYQSIVSVLDLTNDQVKDVLSLVLDHLQLSIVMEKTPDYTAFSLLTGEDE